MKDLAGKRRVVFEAEIEENLGELAKFVENVAADYRKQGIPIGKDGRISMKDYAILYGDDVKQDIKEEAMHEDETGLERLKHAGEMLECLVYALFYKNLGERCIVTRASRHDDSVNKIDTILLDEKGNLICTFDEVGAVNSEVYQEKQKMVIDRNARGGATVKYGLRLETINGRRAVFPAAAENLPLFYIALSEPIIKEAARKFSAEQGKQSDFERKIFFYFIDSISAQIKRLELEDHLTPLNPKLKERLSAFKGLIGGLKKEK